MEGLSSIVMRRTYGVAVAVRHVTVRAMLGVHSPRTLVTAMIHRWWLSLDVDTDTGPGAVRLWHGGGVRSGGCPVGSDVVLRDVHRRRAADAMRALTG